MSSLEIPGSLSSKDRNKLKSRHRRNRKRADAQLASQNPSRKAVHLKRVAEAKPNYLEVIYDANGLPHSVPAWIGSRTAQELEFLFDDAPASHGGTAGIGGRQYTQAEVDALTGTLGFKYIGWLGMLTIAILDSRRRVIALLGGTPKNTEDWAKVTKRVSDLMEERQTRIRLSEDKLHHRRAQETDPYAAVGRGLSHGGGQTEPGELYQNATNTNLTDDLLQDPDIQKMIGFITLLFSLWAPKLYSFYARTRDALQWWRPNLRWNFANSVFAACTFNFGPRAFTRPHLDFANLSWGWCSITPLGSFDPDFGGHLILWDLRLVIRFPPGSTIFIPSAIIRHSNVPIRSHETRSSFTQYTAGGIFRWVRNGFRTDEDFENQSSGAEKAARAAEAETRWEDGMDMFSTIDEL
ncbi:hypothetical protein K438DRAFT_1965309 [Mycena galopus ATCC 62051]|nr:hypothetical protein K438DRAFT_1970395 [Mycena galopus ATCC 62051]KAF8202826.1 hypothetical protein K438DRAFT_1965309 [Mycena galopus ATCC 62051]